MSIRVIFVLFSDRCWLHFLLFISQDPGVYNYSETILMNFHMNRTWMEKCARYIHIDVVMITLISSTLRDRIREKVFGGTFS